MSSAQSTAPLAAAMWRRGRRYDWCVQRIRLLVLVAVSACGERASPPLEVVVPVQHAERTRISDTECKDAEQICGYAIARDCPGVDRDSCRSHCVGSGIQSDGGVGIGEVCGHCIWAYAVICDAANRAAGSACELMRACEAERRVVRRHP